MLFLKFYSGPYPGQRGTKGHLFLGRANYMLSVFSCIKTQVGSCIRKQMTKNQGWYWYI